MYQLFLTLSENKKAEDMTLFFGILVRLNCLFVEQAKDLILNRKKEKKVGIFSKTEIILILILISTTFGSRKCDDEALQKHHCPVSIFFIVTKKGTVRKAIAVVEEF